VTAAGRRPVEVHGYALVSNNDCIAAADGVTPPTLRNAKDWEYYQNAQAHSALVVFGRRSHEFEPNVRGEARLVVSRTAAGLEQRADGWWWDPAQVGWPEVAARLLPGGGEVAAGGGQGLFDLFLAIGFDAFHLSRARHVTLPGGLPIFSACGAGVTADQVLTNAGLRVGEHLPLDPEAGVEMDVWRRPR
jgi:hypothetical protein